MNTLTYFHFRTTIEGKMHVCKVLGYGIADAVASLRGMLYDGETIVGWE